MNKNENSIEEMLSFEELDIKPSGRPKKQDHERRSKHIMINLTPKEKTLLAEKAESLGLPLSTYTRQIILTTLNAQTDISHASQNENQ